LGFVAEAVARCHVALDVRDVVLFKADDVRYEIRGKVGADGGVGFSQGWPGDVGVPSRGCEEFGRGAVGGMMKCEGSLGSLRSISGS
jgi:hypothetical protein